MTERTDRARPSCFEGWHDDPDDSGMCIHCCLILDPEPDEDPNDYRRSNSWPDIPTQPKESGA